MLKSVGFALLWLYSTGMQNSQTVRPEGFSSIRHIGWWMVDVFTLLLVITTLLGVVAGVVAAGADVASGSMFWIGGIFVAYISGLLIGLMLEHRKINVQLRRKVLALWIIGSIVILIPTYIAAFYGYQAHGTTHLGDSSVAEVVLSYTFSALIFTFIQSVILGVLHHRLGQPDSMLYAHRSLARQVIQTVIVITLAIVAFLWTLSIVFTFDPPDEG